MALREFERHARVPRHAEDDTYVREVLPKGLGAYDDVVKVHQLVLLLDLRENYIDGPLKGRGCIFLPEGHSKEPEETHVGREIRLVPAGLVHFDLSRSAAAV